MKVLVFTSLFPNSVWPQHGVFIKERMAQVARIEGCEVKVVAPVPWFPPVKLSRYWLFSQVPRQETVEGLEVHHPRYPLLPKAGMTLHGWGMFLWALPLLKRIQRSFDFDLIDAHYVYPDGYAAVLLGRCLKKPVVVSARGSDINQFAGFPVIRKFLRYTFRRARRIIAVSSSLKEKMVELGAPAEKIALIPNGVDPDKFHPIDRAEARRRLNLPERKILLSVGGLKPVKGFDFLIRALKILAEEHRMRDVLLVICGEGEARKELEALAASLQLQDRVYFAGNVPHENLHLWYSAADLFCLASSREGCPNVILEALACGLPVVATPVGGIPDILCSEDLGLLADRNDQKLAGKIFQAFSRSWPTGRILEHMKGCTWMRVAREVVEVFRSALPVGRAPCQSKL